MWLTPLYDLVVSTALSSGKLFADDTTLPVLDPGHGRTKTGRLWCYAVDDRPWSGATQPAAAYVYSEDRKGVRPAAHLTGFKGVLQVDGYAGYADSVDCDQPFRPIVITCTGDQNHAVHRARGLHGGRLCVAADRCH